MTISDPIIQTFDNHLDELFMDPYLEPNYRLIEDLEDKLRYEKQITQDPSLLQKLAPAILRIINSDQTTSETKRYATRILDIVLPYYTFSQIAEIFNEDLMLRAFQGKDYLKCVLAKVIQKAEPSKIVYGPLFLQLFKTFAEPNLDIATVDAVQKAIVALTLKSDEIRQKFLNDPQIAEILNQMKDDTVIRAREMDLICEVLHVIPTFSDSFYLVSEEDIAKSGDILFYQFCLTTWVKLLCLVYEYDNVGFLTEKLKPQFDFCCRVFTHRETLLANEEFLDFEELGTTELMISYSYIAPSVFKELEEKYHMVDHAIKTYQKDPKSLTFISKVNTLFLRDKYELYAKFSMSHPFIELFCSLVEDTYIFRDRLIPTYFPNKGFQNLVFEDIFRLFKTLSLTPERIEKMVTIWPLIIEKVINSDINNSILVDTYDLELHLRSLLSCGVPLGNLEDSVREKLHVLKGKVLPSVEEPLTELH